MARFVNTENGVVVSVADDKADRFASALWEPQAASGEKKTAQKRASSDK